jgi:hypothetical protein
MLGFAARIWVGLMVFLVVTVCATCTSAGCLLTQRAPGGTTHASCCDRGGSAHHGQSKSHCPLCEGPSFLTSALDSFHPPGMGHLDLASACMHTCLALSPIAAPIGAGVANPLILSPSAPPSTLLGRHCALLI